MKSPYLQLIDIIDNAVVNFRSDMYHDERIIMRDTSRQWVHVAHKNGTHIYMLPERIDDDKPIKYLFGRKKPSGIYRDILAVIETYGFEQECTWTYYDGRVVRLVTRKRAAEMYARAVDTALAGGEVAA